MKLYESAMKMGVCINPGPQWSVNKEHSKSRLRLCFASPTHEEINQGVAALAEVCRREFGVSTPAARVDRAR
jgi:2-aminoadipate transaminase